VKVQSLHLPLLKAALLCLLRRFFALL